MSYRIRAARIEDADALADVAVRAWRETYPAIMPAEYLANLSVEARAKMFRERLTQLPPKQALLVAVDDAETVAGFAACGPTRDACLGTDGEIFAINLLNRAKRQRVGHAMMAAMAQDLAAQGFNAVGLWVLDANAPALAFYRKLGGTPGPKQLTDFAGTKLPETAMQWPSPAALLRAATIGPAS